MHCYTSGVPSIGHVLRPFSGTKIVLMSNAACTSGKVLSPGSCSSSSFRPRSEPRYIGEFIVHLTNCSIDDHCCKFLMRGLSRCPAPNTTATGQLSMNLWYNSIHEEGAHYIVQVLRNSSIVRRLKLGCGGCSIGEPGLKSIAEALITNSSLVQLLLYYCSLKITEESGPVLRDMLQRNSTLEALSLPHNDQVSDTGAFFIAEGLKQNSSLSAFELRWCGIGDEGVKSLGDALVENVSLKRLDLCDNDDITERGFSALTECLRANSGLLELRLPGHLTFVPGVQEAVNVVRRRNKNPLIRVYYTSYDAYSFFLTNDYP